MAVENTTNPAFPLNDANPKPNAGLSPDDYYINEQGLLVFTAAHHRKRGYCCQSGCRHCPYGAKRPAKHVENGAGFSFG